MAKERKKKDSVCVRVNMMELITAIGPNGSAMVSRKWLEAMGVELVEAEPVVVSETQTAVVFEKQTPTVMSQPVEPAAAPVKAETPEIEVETF